ncbi:MAG: ankyrin repeat domain-containing protein [Pseudomonadota bacterium]|jgi:ankyrin repeat protein|uniref:ankyrin repeat domain-containing protein n=1 Tax=Marinobacter sp. TaxID=50741 RepID=UPI002EA5030E|nr:ankyrin repeat domain-containing protein [Pseudomonadota bacterium]
MPNNRHGKPQKPASQKDEDAVAFAQGIFELARNGGAGPLSVMLSAGVPANMRNSDGETLLMLASRNGHTDTVRLLLEQGARADVQDNHGNTARSVAATEEVRRLLDDHGQ